MDPSEKPRGDAPVEPDANDVDEVTPEDDREDASDTAVAADDDFSGVPDPPD